jgi:hypothetical protein
MRSLTIYAAGVIQLDHKESPSPYQNFRSEAGSLVAVCLSHGGGVLEESGM